MMMVIMRRKNMMVIMIMESCQKMMLCYIWCYTLRQARGTGVGDHYQCQACLFCHYTKHSSSYNIIIMQHHHHHKSKTKTSWQYHPALIILMGGWRIQFLQLLTVFQCILIRLSLRLGPIWAKVILLVFFVLELVLIILPFLLMIIIMTVYMIETIKIMPELI